MSRVQRADAVEKLFPSGVVAFETNTPGAVDDLLRSERECVVRCVDRRIKEFAAGRACARACLAEFGLESTALPAGPDRMPIWPAGVAGSITHTGDYCLAVACLETQFAAIGVDAARIGDMSASLWELIMLPEERDRLQGLEETVCQQTATVVFSAKEAFYKCQYALTRLWLGFESVVVDIQGNAFEMSVREASHPICSVQGPWIGRFSIDQTLVITSIASERKQKTS